jgi:hypothetical protein
MPSTTSLMLRSAACPEPRQAASRRGRRVSKHAPTLMQRLLALRGQFLHTLFRRNDGSKGLRRLCFTSTRLFPQPTKLCQVPERWA